LQEGKIISFIKANKNFGAQRAVQRGGQPTPKVHHGFKYGHMLPDVPVSMGIYAFSCGILRHIPDTGSIEQAVFTPLAIKNKTASFKLKPDEQWISVNDVKNVREVEESPQLLELKKSGKSAKTSIKNPVNLIPPRSHEPGTSLHLHPDLQSVAAVPADFRSARRTIGSAFPARWR
jgi:hypothetical protein